MEQSINSDLLVSDIAYEGKGVAKVDGYVYFIPKTAIGDRVRAKVVKKRKNFSFGVLESIAEPSKDRIDPFCLHYAECGGCHYMHLDYSKQLETKRNQLAAILTKIGKIPKPPVDEFIPSPLELHYRNKAVLHVDKGKLGYISIDKEKLVNIDCCPICDELVNSSIEILRRFISLESVRDSEIANVSIRSNKSPEGVSIIFGVQGSLSGKTTKLEEELSNKGIAFSIHESQKPKNSTSVFSGGYRTLAGYQESFEKIGKYSFRVSPFSFFQVNRHQAENLVKTVTSEISKGSKDLNSKKALDIYCGVGLFSLPLADVAQQVCGIDSSKNSINDAKENARLHGFGNTDFIRGKAREVTNQFLGKKLGFDVAILNPPRQGVDRTLLANLYKLSPEKILYISCSPPTLARDLHFLTKLGFEIKKVIPIDMFPHTYHIESISILEKR